MIVEQGIAMKGEEKNKVTAKRGSDVDEEEAGRRKARAGAPPAQLQVPSNDQSKENIDTNQATNTNSINNEEVAEVGMDSANPMDNTPTSRPSASTEPIEQPEKVESGSKEVDVSPSPRIVDGSPSTSKTRAKSVPKAKASMKNNAFEPVASEHLVKSRQDYVTDTDGKFGSKYLSIFK